ncbi:methionine/alanine import family NSS transporter small subunit [Pseudalkalibacillus salsuginis]|nr:methionine/alanine import family NSS transporter small subunit [Pseudalkalibacillus salsuginis]MCF6409072.1 methionine/alanine import family NSS transporter small subunit [Pseudalkalibacillus salsuginis]
MSGGAITMMVIGIVVLWGGLAASITNAVKSSKQK